MTDTIINSFDVWSDAQGIKSKGRVKSIENISLEGVKRLKEFVLQLAIQGRLGTSNESDESVETLHANIIKAKEALIEKGELRKSKALQPIQTKEIPFNLPYNWKWLRLGDLGICSTGKTPKTSISQYFGGNIPFVGPGQIDNSGNISEPEKFLTEKGSDYSTIANLNDIVMVCIGGSIGKSAIVKKRMAFNQQLNAIKPLFVNSDYLNYSMNSSLFQKAIIDNLSPAPESNIFSLSCR